MLNLLPEPIKLRNVLIVLLFSAIQACDPSKDNSNTPNITKAVAGDTSATKGSTTKFDEDEVLNTIGASIEIPENLRLAVEENAPIFNFQNDYQPKNVVFSLVRNPTGIFDSNSKLEQCSDRIYNSESPRWGDFKQLVSDGQCGNIILMYCLKRVETEVSYSISTPFEVKITCNEELFKDIDITLNDDIPKVGTSLVHGSLGLSSDITEFASFPSTNCSEEYSWKRLDAGIFTIPLAEPFNTKKDFSISFRDFLGRRSSCIPLSLIHDNQPPENLALTINNNSGLTTIPMVNLNFSGSSDVDQISFGTENNCENSNWIPLSSNHELDLQISGTHTIFYRGRDIAKNETPCQSRSITVDLMGNTTPSININGGSLVTSSTNVTLGLSGSDISQMYVTNDSSCSTGGAWEDFGESKSWQIQESNSPETVYVTFKFLNGTLSNCLQAIIRHDTQVPTNTSIVINSGGLETSASQLNLTLGAVDASSMYITENSTCLSGGTWEPYLTTKSWSISTLNQLKTIYVKFRDSAGNVSDCISDSIVHDSVAPDAASVQIASNASTSSTSDVSLDLSATGNPNQMYITNESGCNSGGTWEAYSTSKSWTLASGAGTKSVYVAFRDSLLNTSTCISDSIVIGGPLQLSAVNDGDVTLALHAHRITWSTATGGYGNLAYYEVSLGTSPGLTDIISWQNVGLTDNYLFTNLELVEGQTYYGNVRVTDSFNNTSSATSGNGVQAGKYFRISSGYYHNCVLKHPGDLKCFGSALFGALGTGSTVSPCNSASTIGTNLPKVDLGTGRTVLDFSTYRFSTCAILDNSKVKCWGYNTDGRLGLGSVGSVGTSSEHIGDNFGEMGDSLSYINLGTGITATKLKKPGMGRFMCTILNNGRSKCWGVNTKGSLGVSTVPEGSVLGSSTGLLGDNMPYTEWGDVGGTPLSVVDIAASEVNTCALFSTGKLKCLGEGQNGISGIGSTTSYGTSTNPAGNSLDFVQFENSVNIKSLFLSSSTSTSSAILS